MSDKQKRVLNAKSKKKQVQLVTESHTLNFPLDEPVKVHDVEEAFQLVRIHLEGNDHTVRFPNPETGIFEKLQENVIYHVYGHKYDIEEIWKPRKVISKSGKMEMIEVSTDKPIFSGKLKRLFKRFLRSDQWKDCYFVLEYPTLKCYQQEGDSKPIDEFGLREKSNGSDNEGDTAPSESDFAETSLYKDAENGFQVILGDEIWVLQAPGYRNREDWMYWINITSFFDNKKWEKIQEKKREEEEKIAAAKKQKRKPKQKKKAVQENGHNVDSPSRSDSRKIELEDEKPKKKSTKKPESTPETTKQKTRKLRNKEDEEEDAVPLKTSTTSPKRKKSKFVKEYEE